MDIRSLEKAIKTQREVNVSLFNQIPMPTREDPSNEKAEPILKQWRDGSSKLKEMIKELQTLEDEKIDTEEDIEVFINGYGEATKRKITNSSYERNQKRLTKDIFNFIQ